jgi:hypothetical protein
MQRKDMPLRLQAWQCRRLLRYEDRLGMLKTVENWAVINSEYLMSKEFETVIDEWKQHDL